LSRGSGEKKFRQVGSEVAAEQEKFLINLSLSGILLLKNFLPKIHNIWLQIPYFGVI